MIAELYAALKRRSSTVALSWWKLLFESQALLAGRKGIPFGFAQGRLSTARLILFENQALAQDDFL
jgi:hypothetical protein